MRWQRPARWALALFVLAFAAIVVIALRRPSKPIVRPETPRIDQKTVAEFGQFTHTITDDKGKVRYTISAKRALTYPDGRQVLSDAELTVPDRNGRTLKVGGGAMEIVIPSNGSAPVQTVTVTKGARLSSDDGLEVTSDQAIYDERTGVVTIP